MPTFIPFKYSNNIRALFRGNCLLSPPSTPLVRSIHNKGEELVELVKSEI